MIDLIHKCTGPHCLKCAMAKRGYVRCWMGFWHQPNGHGPLLSDEEAEQLASPQLKLFDFEEVETA